MIKDTLSFMEKYKPLHPAMAKAIDYLTKTDLSHLLPGRYDIDGDNLYAMINEYETKPLYESEWEAHRKYIDIQCMIKGQEQISYANIDRMESKGPYDADHDVLFLLGQSDDELLLKEGDVAIFWPEDVHRPGIANKKPVLIKKVVIKVRL